MTKFSAVSFMPRRICLAYYKRILHHGIWKTYSRPNSQLFFKDWCNSHILIRF